MASINNGVKFVKDTPYRGKDVWYFLQSVDAPVGAPGILPAHQESGDTSIEGDSLDEQTKMGRIVAPSTNEDSIEVTSYMVPGDEATDAIIKAKHDGKQIKVWRVIVDKRLAVTEDDHKAYPAMFGYGIVDSADISDEDSFSEIDWTINILGKLVDGTFPLTDAEVQSLQALYDYERPGEKTGEFSDAATAVSISPSTFSVKAGETYQLTIKGPDDVKVTSSDDLTATVDNSGKVTGVKAGPVTITATSGSLKATSTGTVTTV